MSAVYLDEEDQLVTDVTMRRERRPRLKAYQQRAALGALEGGSSASGEGHGCSPLGQHEP
jgi:hypothetical protein